MSRKLSTAHTQDPSKRSLASNWTDEERARIKARFRITNASMGGQLQALPPYRGQGSSIGVKALRPSTAIV